MPNKPNSPCRYPLCPDNAVRDGLCNRHYKIIDRQRGTSVERGYNWRWHKSTVLYLDEHPLCKVCELAGRIEPARVVDHVIPHRGDYALFWDEDNWQGLCFKHHSMKTMVERNATATY
jgi:5-methylcytosine-specific restriction protein A